MGTKFWNEDDEKTHRAFILESARIWERYELQAAERRGKQEGREEGRKEGRAEGRKEAYVDMALKMVVANRFDDATIAELSGLTEDEVRRLREQA